MYEVEAKVWIKTDEEWQAILEKVKKIAIFKKEELKKDLYFGLQLSNKALFRLRTVNNNKHEITVKDKTIKEGIEQSKEESFQIDNFNAFISFTKKLSLEVLLKKKKQSLVFVHKNLIIELNVIDGLGNFLEIEYLCKNKTDIPFAHRKIISIFQDLGFTKQDFEEQTYMQLLKA